MPTQDENTKIGNAATTYPNTGTRSGNPSANPASDQDRMKGGQKPTSMPGRDDTKKGPSTGNDEDEDGAQDANAINKGAGEWSGQNRTVGQGGNVGDSKGGNRGGSQSGPSQGYRPAGSPDSGSDRE
jgi:hypothetical protein